MAFDSPELLSQAGYDSGDVLPVFTHPPTSSRNVATTSTTFVNETTIADPEMPWDRLVPDTDNLVVCFSAFVSPGTDETYDVRYQNTDGNETVISRTGITAQGDIFEGWTDYDPTNPSGTESVTFQHRTDPGTNSSSVFDPVFLVGVRL